MNLSNIKLKKIFSTKKVVKVITGLNNFDINYIVKLVKAAEIGRANYVDIVASPEIVSIVKSLTSIPVCVSSINPKDLYLCTLAGADMVEIGNFDSLYIKGIILSDNQILNLAKETQSLLPNSFICVTIPHTLLLDQQIQLALKLKNIGIHIIQTEGLVTKKQILPMTNNYIFTSMYKASAALSSSYAIANSNDIPVIASSGINSISALIAVAYRASAVGIGSLLKNFNTIINTANCINEIVVSLSYSNYYLLKQKSLKRHKLININVEVEI